MTASNDFQTGAQATVLAMKATGGTGTMSATHTNWHQQLAWSLTIGAGVGALGFGGAAARGPAAGALRAAAGDRRR